MRIINQVYTSDPAAARGRIQAVVDALEGKVTCNTGTGF